MDLKVTEAELIKMIENELRKDARLDGLSGIETIAFIEFNMRQVYYDIEAGEYEDQIINLNH